MNTTSQHPKAPCPARAVLAEDEPVLARGLVRTLKTLWPQLEMAAVVHDGLAAIEAAALHRPDVLFLDIQMPECTGIEAARQIIDDWPDGLALPLIVFITAFDRFAIDAFEQAAADYILKPVDTARLAASVQRLQTRLQDRQALPAQALSLLQSLARVSVVEPLRHIQAAVGAALHLVPVSDVQCFLADDKYVQVLTADRSWLIRTPMRELAQRLDPKDFVQIHRGCVVRWSAIQRVVREDTGRMTVYLHGREHPQVVSRSHSHHFKAM
jgi:DNA-binding LytR/AlgR family response regulator